MIKKILNCILFTLLVSCSFYDDQDKSITITFTVGNDDLLNNSSRSYSPNVVYDDTALLDTLYSNYGNVVNFGESTTLSPESFSLANPDAYIGNTEITYYLTTSIHNYVDENSDELILIDICSEQPHTEEISIYESTEIDSVYMALSLTAGIVGLFDETNDSNNYKINRPTMTIYIPGYTDNEWPDFEEIIASSSDYMGYDVPTYRRRYLGDHLFEFELATVMPRFAKYELHDYSDLGFYNYYNNIQQFIYFTEYETSGLVMPGVGSFTDDGEMYDASDYANIAGAGEGNSGLLVFPFEQIEITSDTTFIFNINTDDLFSVYDNGTPDYKNDDILMAKNGYWDHFTLQVIQ